MKCNNLESYWLLETEEGKSEFYIDPCTCELGFRGKHRNLLSRLLLCYLFVTFSFQLMFECSCFSNLVSSQFSELWFTPMEA